MKFLRVRRLNAARHTLATGDPEEIWSRAWPCHRVLAPWKVARDYKLLFGENPSATLTHR